MYITGYIFIMKWARPRVRYCVKATKGSEKCRTQIYFPHAKHVTASAPSPNLITSTNLCRLLITLFFFFFSFFPFSTKSYLFTLLCEKKKKNVLHDFRGWIFLLSGKKAQKHAPTRKHYNS